VVSFIMTSWETANALGHKSAQQLFKDFKHVRVAPGYASTTINRFFFFHCFTIHPQPPAS